MTILIGSIASISSIIAFMWGINCMMLNDEINRLQKLEDELEQYINYLKI